MTVGIAIGAGLMLSVGVLIVAFAVADQFELNLFHIGDA